MKSLKIIIILFALSCGTALFNGCLDAPVAPIGNVNGKVYDRYGYPAYYSVISEGDYPIAKPDYKGNFTFDGIKYPYDLVVGSEPQNESKYIGLSSNIAIVYDYIGFDIPALNYRIAVSFPPLKSQKTLFINFLSADNFKQLNYTGAFYRGDSLFGIGFYMHGLNPQINGKLMYLEASTDGSGRIISYDKFGIKNVTLYTNELDQRFDFSPDEINHTPETGTLNFTVTAPNNLDTRFTDCFINFPSLNNCSDIMLEEIAYENSGSFNVPVFTGIDYRFKMNNIYYNWPVYNPFKKTGQKWEFAKPGNNVTITHDAPIVLLTPPDRQNSVSDSTTFSIFDPGEKGVYVFKFFDGMESTQTSVFTDKTSFKFAELRSRLVNFPHNYTSYWCVIKYPKYTTINDFVAVNYVTDDLYNSIPCSQTFIFTTAP